MKRIYQYIIFGFVGLLIFACAKEGLWNQNTEVPESEKGTITGQLINDDNNQPLKGIKILFERQTKKDGSNTFVDTVSTDVEGKFSYSVPFPNKVRLVVRDTGRYHADTTFVEVLEHRDYPIVMNSHPRFGTSNISVKLLNENELAMEGVSIALYTRESSLESYSAVDTFLTDGQGNVYFKDVAFPVRYKVAVAEKEVAYDMDAVEGFLQTKDDLNLTLHSRAKFGKADVKLVAKYFYTNTIATNVEVSISSKSILDENFSTPRITTLNANGELNLPGIIYPSEIKIAATNATAFPFVSTTVIVEESNAKQPIPVNLFDSTPRYWDMTPSSVIAENTLVAFYEGVSVQEMELDSKGNIYAVTTDNTLVRIKSDGSGHKVLATGFTSSWGLALVDDYTMYVVENTNGHSVKKVVINPETDVATVTLYAGNGSASGTADGSVVDARFNRPSDAVYDASRNCLWIVEWQGQRIRKIDLSTGTVSTLATGTGFGFGVALTKDYKYLYIASHTSPAGIVKYDIDNKKMYTVRTGYSIRHLAIAPNGDIYFNINGNYQGKQYKITKEVLVDGNANNTTSTFETIAGNGSWGTLNPVGYVGSPNTILGTKNVDGSPNGIMYDPYRGRLYFSVSGDSRLYYLKNSAVPNN
ncbi:putative lipoprotein, rSAM/lipoprotein system [Sphingobacterium nematocida]|uniref:Putative lipoprotein, rSAM/lipoprotein system n=1 Tax=Sphingobacterium nematocida TaxID=1513896 RepID=A0A1T5C607_9SPHI|nr:hypothetical protein [Sphingobacterium nematocida]SKB54560.1 putative lipoprotein, rSAM/lipoprotein system [Sphingobacterium nematocida]